MKGIKELIKFIEKTFPKSFKFCHMTIDFPYDGEAVVIKLFPSSRKKKYPDDKKGRNEAINQDIQDLIRYRKTLKVMYQEDIADIDRRCRELERMMVEE